MQSVSSTIYESQPIKLVGDWNDVYYPESDGKPMESDVHRDLMLETISSLELFFAEREDVYVTGNIGLYYLEGNARDFVSPDVMVCFDSHKTRRRVFKLWEETSPSVVMEFASNSTWKNDLVEKRELYQAIGVNEYYIFNPLYPKKIPTLIAFKLNARNIYEQVEIVDKSVFSELLGLDIVDTGKTLRLRNSVDRKFLPTKLELKTRANKALRLAQSEAKRAESESKRAESESKRADNAVEFAKIEGERAKSAELELERLREELRLIRNLK